MKHIVGTAPDYLQKLCVTVSKLAQRQWLRSSTYRTVTSVFHVSQHIDMASEHLQSQLWNQLPAAI